MKQTVSVRNLTPVKPAVVGVFMVVLMMAASAPAVMIPQTIDQLVANSSHVVRGDVRRIESRWDPTHSYIYTSVTVLVTEWHLGVPRDGNTITLFVPGGEVDGVGLRVEHAPRFATGEDVVVFLNEAGDFFSVTSWEQGKYTVVNDQVMERKTPVAAFISTIEQASQR